MAALAHASIIANGFSLVGLLAAAMIWATQRGRSAYVRAHALQALAYQGLVVLLGVILTLSWGACLAVTLLPLALRPELYVDGSVPGPFWLALSGVVVPIGFGILATVYSLVGALQAYRGHAFHYPFLARLAHDEAQAPVGSAAPEALAGPQNNDAPPVEAPGEPAAAPAEVEAQAETPAEPAPERQS
jgi:uncharacterized Tic20 family protein